MIPWSSAVFQPGLSPDPSESTPRSRVPQFPVAPSATPHPSAGASVALRPSAGASVGLHPAPAPSAALHPLAGASVALHPLAGESVAVHPAAGNSVAPHPAAAPSVAPRPGLASVASHPAGGAVVASHAVAPQAGAASVLFHPVGPASAKLQPVPPEPESRTADAVAPGVPVRWVARSERWEPPLSAALIRSGSYTSGGATPTPARAPATAAGLAPAGLTGRPGSPAISLATRRHRSSHSRTSPSQART